MKYAFYSIAALIFASHAFGDEEGCGPCRPQCSEVFISSPSTIFEIEFTALILQPTASNLHYAAEADPLPAPSPNWKIHDIDTDYHFGFDIGISGRFQELGTTLNLDWEHYHSSDSGSVNLPSSEMVGPFFAIGPDVAPYNSAHGNAIFHFDAVNLDYGINVSFGSRVLTHWFGGIGFARIKEVLKSTFSNPDFSSSRIINSPSTFTGAGPQIGMDFSVRIVDGLTLNGFTCGTLFVGNSENYTVYRSFAPELERLGITPPNRQKTKVHDRTQVVPGFEGSLGLAYTYTFCNCMALKIEAGYDAAIYLNAIQSVDMGSQVVLFPTDTTDTVGVYARTFQRTISNFALAGPYAMIAFAF